MPLNSEFSQATTPLVDALRSCSQTANTPFYTPGHKRGRGISAEFRQLLGEQVFRADLPELPELDNLFAPEGAIQAAQELAAAAFGAERTWFLVNGSTCGVIAAILATCEAGDKIILPRNVHQSAIAGLILSGAMPIFIAPEYDPGWDMTHSISPAAVAATLAEHPDAKAVLLLYPTYHGVCGDIAAIATIVHQYGIPLLVDEAHAPHFAFHPALPAPALAATADLVVQSTHKVLSAMTQAAMLHLQGNRIAGDRVSKALQLVQSTSPSYLLLASLDAARQQMALQGRALLTQTLTLAERARNQIHPIPGLAAFGAEPIAPSAGLFALDRTRLTVRVSDLGLDGFTADQILHQQFGVTAELPALQHLTFIISLGNTEADIQQLVKALTWLATQQKKETTTEAASSKVRSLICPHTPPLFYTLRAGLLSPRQAFFAASETLAISQAIDRISAEIICPYPPGIPVLMPGEVITHTAIAYLQTVLAAGGFISGCADPTLQTLKVVRS